MISIVLTVHNKGWLLNRVLSSIQEYKSDLTKEIIVVLDGCSDDSLNVVKVFDFNVSSVVVETPDIFETRANNVGLLHTTQPFALLIQDDMVMYQQDFDKRLLKPFLTWNDVFAVTARDTADDRILEDRVEFFNNSGIDPATFYVRDVAIRGPLMLEFNKAKHLGLFDPYFAPLTFDDHDLCIRAWKENRWVSGSYPTSFISKHEWGTTRLPEKREWHQKVYNTNEKKLIERHINSYDHHSEERKLE